MLAVCADFTVTFVVINERPLWKSAAILKCVRHVTVLMPHIILPDEI